jgi:hypothetical protein
MGVARMKGEVGERFSKVDLKLRSFVIGYLLTQLELSYGTDKALDFIDEAETAAARELAQEVGA